MTKRNHGDRSWTEILQDPALVWRFQQYFGVQKVLSIILIIFNDHINIFYFSLISSVYLFPKMAEPIGRTIVGSQFPRKKGWPIEVQLFFKIKLKRKIASIFPKGSPIVLYCTLG